MNLSYETGPVPAVVAGPGCSARLAERLPGDARSLLLVCDAGVAAAGLPERVEAALPDTLAVERFVAPAGEPNVATIDAAAEVARGLDRPVIVGLGGGTAMDIAKLVAALTRNPGSVAQYALGARPLSGRTPAFMIPTTAGTGAEVARTCVLSDDDGRKLWAWSPELGPDGILLDPELTLSLPPGVTIATGLDAFVHALEATSSRAGNRWIEAMALAAIRLVRTNLATVATRPDDLAARQAMQEAALLAGMAINAGGTGIAHNIGHALGTCYHLPHGVAVALGLQASLDWSVAGAPERFSAAAAAFEPGFDAAQLPAACGDWMQQLGFGPIAAALLPDSLDAALVAAAMAATENAPMARNSARPPRAEEFPGLAERVIAVCDRCRERSLAGATS